MVETFQAKYVSLHVRVSNVAARHLYEDTLGFKNEKTEAKYYADGEDAFCMRLDLDKLRNQVNEAAAAAADDDDAVNEADADAGNEKPDGAANGATEGLDEGDAVGDVGHDPKADAAARDEPRKIKVAVGRGLGVGDLVEKFEGKH